MKDGKREAIKSDATNGAGPRGGNFMQNIRVNSDHTQDEANQRGARGGVSSGELGVRPRCYWFILENG